MRSDADITAPKWECTEGDLTDARLGTRCREIGDHLLGQDRNDVRFKVWMDRFFGEGSGAQATMTVHVQHRVQSKA